jgi:hypothetical protein
MSEVRLGEVVLYCDEVGEERVAVISKLHTQGFADLHVFREEGIGLARTTKRGEAGKVNTWYPREE